MPGARPTINSSASESPNGGTGALNQSGSRARAWALNSASRGHSRQSRSGSVMVATALLVEFFVIGPWRHGGRALQELRGVMTRLARGRALGRVAAELGLQFHQVGKDVGLPAQLVGNHRRLAGYRGNDGNPDAAALHGLNQGAEIAIAREQHDLVDMLGQLHG